MRRLHVGARDHGRGVVARRLVDRADAHQPLGILLQPIDEAAFARRRCPRRAASAPVELRELARERRGARHAGRGERLERARALSASGTSGFAAASSCANGSPRSTARAQRDRHESEPPGRSAPAVAAMRSCATFAACSSAATRAVERLASRSVAIAGAARAAFFCAASNAASARPWRRARPRLPRRSRCRDRRADAARLRAPRRASVERRIGLRTRAARRRRLLGLGETARSRPCPIGAGRRDRRAGPSPARRRRRAPRDRRARADRRPAAAADWRARASCCSSARSAPRAAPSRSSRGLSAPVARSRATAPASRPRRRAPAAIEPPVHAVRAHPSRSAGQPRVHAAGEPFAAAGRRRAAAARRRPAAVPAAAVAAGGASARGVSGAGSTGSAGFTGSDAISVAFRSMVGGRRRCRLVRWTRVSHLPSASPVTPGRRTAWHTAARQRRGQRVTSGSNAEQRRFGPAAPRPTMRLAPASRSGAATSSDRQ